MTGSKAKVLALLGGIALLRLGGALLIPLSPDEAYYWLWTRPLQASYFDHPPMVAYWIWAGTRLAGDTPGGVRLIGVVASCLTSLLVWDTARRLFHSRSAAAVAVLALNCTPLFTVAGILVTPNNPLLLTWSVCLWCLVRLFDTGNVGYLYGAALAGGLACLSKYTGLFLAPGILATFLCFPDGRRWLAGPHPYCATLLAGACGLPVLLWNRAHDWASFAKQFDHAFANPPRDPGWPGVAVFVGSQLGIVTPIVFVLAVAGMAWALWTGWRARLPGRFLIGATSLPMLLFFTIHAAGTAVQAHWSGPAYLGGMIALSGLITRSRLVTQSGVMTGAGPAVSAPISRRWNGGQRWLAAGLGLGLTVSTVAVLHAAFAVLPLPIRWDPLKRMASWSELARAVATQRASDPNLFLFTDKHEPTGVLSFLLADHPIIFLLGPIRPSYYDTTDLARLRGHDGLFITRSRADASAQVAPYFETFVSLGKVPLLWRGQVADAYDVYRGTGYRGGLFTAGNGLHGAKD